MDFLRFTGVLAAVLVSIGAAATSVYAAFNDQFVAAIWMLLVSKFLAEWISGVWETPPARSPASDACPHCNAPTKVTPIRKRAA